MDIISYILVVVGWVIVHCLSHRRDTKKEWRAFALHTVDAITNIEQQSINYHISPTRDISLEHKIKLELIEHSTG